MDRGRSPFISGETLRDRAESHAPRFVTASSPLTKRRFCCMLNLGVLVSVYTKRDGRKDHRLCSRYINTRICFLRQVIRPIAEDISRWKNSIFIATCDKRRASFFHGNEIYWEGTVGATGGRFCFNRGKCTQH